jgi:hypothetical protein
VRQEGLGKLEKFNEFENRIGDLPARSIVRPTTLLLYGIYTIGMREFGFTDFDLSFYAHMRTI